MGPLTDFLMQRLTLDVKMTTQSEAGHADVRNWPRHLEATIAKIAGKLAEGWRKAQRSFLRERRGPCRQSLDV